MVGAIIFVLGFVVFLLALVVFIAGNDGGERAQGIIGMVFGLVIMVASLPAMPESSVDVAKKTVTGMYPSSTLSVESSEVQQAVVVRIKVNGKNVTLLCMRPYTDGNCAPLSDNSGQ